MEKRDEAMRQLLEMALNYGRKRKSEQTGYLHYCHAAAEQEQHLTIPVVENLLYALALFRSRLIENIQEAKVLLEGILHFQNQADGEFAKGNFPIYLHEFPVCKDRFTGIHTAAPIYAILKHYQQVLGHDLKHRLEKALFLAVAHALKAYEEKGAPFPTAVKIAAMCVVTGQVISKPDLSEKGMELLTALAAKKDETFWFCPASLGSVALSLLFVYPSIKNSQWSRLWSFLEETWHQRTGSFAGPCLKVWQQGAEPQVTVYDLLMSYFSGNISERALKEAPCHLEAVLLFPSGEPFNSPELPLAIEGEILGSKWGVHLTDMYAVSYIENGGIDLNPIFEKGFHPYRLLWGDSSRVHTFVCQGGRSRCAIFSPSSITFTLEGDVEVEDREKSREAMFYMDLNEETEFLVSGKKSSTFLLSDAVSIKDSRLDIGLSFHLEEGEGRFLGHRMPGNRPSQQAAKGTSRYEAYDWQLFLRTVSRGSPCKLRVDLKINEVK